MSHSVSDSEYKREDDPTNKDNKMSPTSSFPHLLALNVNGCQESDVHFIIKPINAGEEISAGFTGGYAEGGRPAIQEQLNILM